MEITFKHYDTIVTIKREQDDLNLDETFDMIKSALIGISWLPSQIDDYIIEKAEELMKSIGLGELNKIKLTTVKEQVGHGDAKKTASGPSTTTYGKLKVLKKELQTLLKDADKPENGRRLKEIEREMTTLSGQLLQQRGLSAVLGASGTITGLMAAGISGALDGIPQGSTGETGVLIGTLALAAAAGAIAWKTLPAAYDKLIKVVKAIKE